MSVTSAVYFVARSAGTKTDESVTSSGDSPGLYFGGFAIASTGAAVALLFLLYGVYQGAFRSLGKALAVDLAPDTLRGSAVGLFGTVVGLAALVAGTVGGQLWDRAGPGAAFAYGAAFAILGAALLAAVLPGQRTPTIDVGGPDS